MKLRVLIAALVMMLVAVAAYGQNAQPNAAPATAVAPSSGQSGEGPSLKLRDPRYRLMKNDVLNIEFPFTPEYNETVTVQPDGFINVRQLPDMHVEGLTTPEVTEALKKAYAGMLHDPQINIVLQSFLNPYFIAYGEVNNPGKFQLYGDTTLTQAIGMAGGFTSHAKHSDVYLFRRVSDQWVSSQKVDVKHMLKSGNLAEDMHLQPGDMIWVPKSTVAKALYIQPLIPYNTFHVNFGAYNF